MERLNIIIYKNAVSNIDTNDYTNQLAKIKANYGDADNIVHLTGGATTGAIAGGTIGGPIGAGIGGIVGGAVGGISSFVIDDSKASEKRKDINKQINKMKVECDQLNSIIVCNVQRDVEDVISNLKKAKQILNMQKIESVTYDKMKILVSKIDDEIKKLEELRDINNQFSKKLRKLGQNQTIGPAS